MNMDRMTEDEIMIAELERIIREEEAKPDGERDAQLIDDCIKEMAEIKGVRAEYSQEEVAEITEKLIRDTEKEKAKRKKLVQRVAGIAAAFVIVVGASACAANPLLVNWIANVFRLERGSILENAEFTYEYQGESIKYNNIYDFVSSEDLNIYYPVILPDNITFTGIQSIDLQGNSALFFTFDKPQLKFMIYFGFDVDDGIVFNDVIPIYVVDDYLYFHIYEDKGNYIARGVCNNFTYYVEYPNLDGLYNILSALERKSK